MLLLGRFNVSFASHILLVQQGIRGLRHAEPPYRNGGSRLRSRRERVPDGDTTALVQVVDGRLPQPLSSISLRGPDSRRLADLVNALQVAADGGRTNCPSESLKHRRVTFTGSGPTVVLTDGVCTGLTFSLDGQALPRLQASSQLDAELRRLAPIR